MLIRIILWWSVFTALTGLIGLKIAGHIFGGFSLGPIIVTPLIALVVVRFLFGVGESGAIPTSPARAAQLVSRTRAASPKGAVWMCGRMMGGLTPLVWMILVEGIGRPWTAQVGEAISRPLLPPLLPWRAAFWVFAVLGLVWCVLFARWFRNRPEEKSTSIGPNWSLFAAAASSRSPHTRTSPGGESSPAATFGSSA